MDKYKSGNYQSQGFYKSFQPSIINRECTITDMTVWQLLSKADRQLGRLINH